LAWTKGMPALGVNAMLSSAAGREGVSLRAWHLSNHSTSSK
jgi:hypothetical protein